MSVSKGDKVEWKWGNGTAKGEVEKTSTSTMKKKIKGKQMTRKGSKDNKAVLIKSEKGGEVLKKESSLK